MSTEKMGLVGKGLIGLDLVLPDGTPPGVPGPLTALALKLDPMPAQRSTPMTSKLSKLSGPKLSRPKPSCPPSDRSVDVRGYVDPEQSGKSIEEQSLRSGIVRDAQLWNEAAEQAKHLLEKYGVQLGEQLGCGKFACAWAVKEATGESREWVVKISGDPADAAAWQHVRDAVKRSRSKVWPKGLAKLRCLEAFPFVVAGEEPRRLYFMIQERLAPLTFSEDTVFTDFADDILDTVDENPEDAVYIVRSLGLDHDEFRNPTAVKLVAETVRWLWDNQIGWGDLHGGNLMASSNGPRPIYKIVDLGYSTSPETEVPEMTEPGRYRVTETAPTMSGPVSEVEAGTVVWWSGSEPSELPGWAVVVFAAGPYQGQEAIIPAEYLALVRRPKRYEKGERALTAAPRLLEAMRVAAEKCPCGCSVGPTCGPKRYEKGERALAIAPGLLEAMRVAAEKCPCGCSVGPTCGPKHARAVEMLRSVAEKCPCGCSAGPTCEPKHARTVKMPTNRFLERMEARRGQMQVNVAVIWKLMADKLYRQGDLPVLAVREAIQNSRDAVQAALRKGLIQAGRIEIEWSENSSKGTGTLSISDNGIGMDERVLVDKFFTLGETGKEGEEALGGFGAAKAVILGSSTTWRWVVETRDLVARSTGAMGYEITNAPVPRQGTKITIYDVKAEPRWGLTGYAHPSDRIQAFLKGSDLGSIGLYFNGTPVVPGMARRAGSHLKKFEAADWGTGTTASIRRYFRGALGGAGRVYVRLGGLLQFTQIVPGVKLEHDIVVDIDTKAKPKDDDYPFNVSRDEFNPYSPAAESFAALLENLSRESQAGSKQAAEYTTVLPDIGTEAEKEAAREFNNLMEEAIGDLAGKAFRELSGLSRAFYEERTPPAVGTDDVGTEDVGTENREIAVSTMPEATPETPDPYTGWRTMTGHRATEEGEGKGKSAGLSLGDRIRGFIEGKFGYLPDSVVNVANAIDQGQEISIRDLDTTFYYVKKAVSERSAGGESIIATAAVATDLLKDLVAAAPEHNQPWLKRRASDVNPFGCAAVLKFSNVNYVDPPKDGEDEDRSRPRRAKRRAARFRKRAKKYVPHLVLWDFVVKMVAKEGGVTIPFGVGFVLDDTVRGLASEESDEFGLSQRQFVMVNPEMLDEVIRAFKDHPYAIATYLHSVASHELAHLPLLGKGHTDEWVKQREDLGAATAPLVQLFAEAVPRLIKGVKKPRRRQSNAKIEAALARAEAAEQRAAESSALAAKYRADVDTLRAQLQTAQDAERAWKLAAQDRWMPIIHRLEALAEVESFLQWLRERPDVLPPGVSPETLAALVRGESASLLALVEAAVQAKEAAGAAEKLPVSGMTVDKDLKAEIEKATVQLQRAGFDVGSALVETGDEDGCRDVPMSPFAASSKRLSPETWLDAVAE